MDEIGSRDAPTEAVSSAKREVEAKGGSLALVLEMLRFN